VEPEICAECGFDSTHLTVPDAVAGLRSMGRRWRELFPDQPDEALRRRPAPPRGSGADAKSEVWSPLEYAAHTRDLLLLFATGVPEVLGGDRPTYPAVEPDPPGFDHGYNDLDPTTVLTELAANADRLAAAAAGARSEAWDRTARIGDTEPDATWLLFHALHDASHHLRDVSKQLQPRSG
jgi:hypothetical protein